MISPDANASDCLVPPIRQRLGPVVLLVLVAMAVFLAGSGRTVLSDPDEGRYALISWTMVQTGNYLEPHINDQPYFDKPPLYFWLTAASFKLFGPGSFSARLVPAIGAALTLTATYLIGAALFARAVGLICGVCALTTIGLIINAKLVRMDIYLVASITFTLWAFIKGYQQQDNRRWFVLMYPPIALGMLIKGPVALFIPMMVIVVFLLLQRQLAVIGRMKLIMGLALTIIIAGPWFIYMICRFPGYGQGSYIGEFFLKHNLHRATGGALGHVESPLIYLAIAVLGMLPWSGLVVLAVARYSTAAFRRTNNDWPAQLLIVWAAVVFLCFSLAKTKLPNYILPAIVPLAVLTARFCYDYWTSDFARRRRQRTFLWAHPIAAITCLIGTIGILAHIALPAYTKYNLGWTNLPDLFGTSFWGQWGWLICTSYRLLGGLIALKFSIMMLRERQLERFAATVAAVMLLIVVDMSYTDLPRLADGFSTSRLAPIVLANSSADDLILFGPEKRQSFPLYIGQQRNVHLINRIVDLSDYKDFATRIIYLSTDDDSYALSPWFPRTRMRILSESRFPYDGTRLVSVSPPPLAPARPTTRPAVDPVGR